MECEVCGKDAGKTVPVKIDGTIFEACSNCAVYGEKLEVQEQRFHKPAVQQKNESIFEMGSGSELKDDFGKEIGKARQRKEMTIEELAKEIFESASYVKRIEAGAIKPSEKLVAKLEKALGVSLRAD